MAETTAAAGDALQQLFTAARSSTGSIALLARWSGDPGRSPLSSLTLAAEVPPDSGSVDGHSDDADRAPQVR